MPFINSNSIFMISGAIINANIKRERAMDMGKYEYNFVEVPFDGNLKMAMLKQLKSVKILSGRSLPRDGVWSRL